MHVNAIPCTPIHHPTVPDPPDVFMRFPSVLVRNISKRYWLQPSEKYADVCRSIYKYISVCLLVSPRLPRRPCSSFLMHGAARTERRRAPKLANCPMATFGLATGRRRSANVRWSSIRHFSAALVGGHCSGGPSSGASACERRPAQCPRRESK